MKNTKPPLFLINLSLPFNAFRVPIKAGPQTLKQMFNTKVVVRGPALRTKLTSKEENERLNFLFEKQNKRISFNAEKKIKNEIFYLLRNRKSHPTLVYYENNQLCLLGLLTRDAFSWCTGKRNILIPGLKERIFLTKNPKVLLDSTLTSLVKVSKPHTNYQYVYNQRFRYPLHLDVPRNKQELQNPIRTSSTYLEKKQYSYLYRQAFRRRSVVQLNHNEKYLEARHIRKIKQGEIKTPYSDINE